MSDTLPTRNSRGTPPRGRNSRAVVRAGILAGLESLLRSLACDPKSVLAEVGLGPSALLDPDAWVDYRQANRLVARSAEASGCPHFGLLLGQEVTAAQLGFSGFMVRAAANVGQALQTLAEHLDLHDTGGRATFNVDADFVQIGYRIDSPSVEFPGHAYDFSAAVLCRLLRDFLGLGWNPAEVRLTRGSEVDTTPYRQYFRSRLVFGCEACVVVFPSRFLGHSLATADAPLFQLLELEAALRQGLEGSRLAGALPRLLRRGLLVNCYSAGELSAAMGIHERTLHRHLQAAGTTYRKELDRVRYAVSTELLSGTYLRVSDIAQSVGYADSATFIRAFRRWSGSSPLAWRKRHPHQSRRSRPTADPDSGSP